MILTESKRAGRLTADTTVPYDENSAVREFLCASLTSSAFPACSRRVATTTWRRAWILPVGTGPACSSTASCRRSQLLRPLGDETGELPRLRVAGTHRPVLAQSRRPEEHDGVVDAVFLEGPEGLEVLGQDTDGPPFVAFEKIRVEVRERLLRHNVQFTLECYDFAL